MNRLSEWSRRLAVGYLHRLGYFVRPPFPPDFDKELRQTVKRVRPHTMTSMRRIGALCEAIRYLSENRVEGDIVECGVWKGGSMMAAALTLLQVGDTDRDLYLFDTFRGMPEPGPDDVDSAYDGYSLRRRWGRGQAEGGNRWHKATADSVIETVASTGYPVARIHTVEGLVEETLPARAPERIGLLRLDTDFYASTRHELIQLFPRLVVGGVLLLDDFGHYESVQRAVNEYFAESSAQIHLQRIDYTGRIGIKQAEKPGA